MDLLVAKEETWMSGMWSQQLSSLKVHLN